MKKIGYVLFTLLISVTTARAAEPINDSDGINCSQLNIVDCQHTPGCRWNGSSGQCKDIDPEAGYCTGCRFIHMQCYGVDSFTYWYGYDVFDRGLWKQSVQTLGMPSRSKAEEECRKEQLNDWRCHLNEDAW